MSTAAVANSISAAAAASVAIVAVARRNRERGGVGGAPICNIKFRQKAVASLGEFIWHSYASTERRDIHTNVLTCQSRALQERIYFGSISLMGIIFSTFLFFLFFFLCLSFFFFFFLFF